MSENPLSASNPVKNTPLPIPMSPNRSTFLKIHKNIVTRGDFAVKKVSLSSRAQGMARTRNGAQNFKNEFKNHDNIST